MSSTLFAYKSGKKKKGKNSGIAESASVAVLTPNKGLFKWLVNPIKF